MKQKQTHVGSHICTVDAPEEARVRKARYISSLNALHEGSQRFIGSRTPASCEIHAQAGCSAHGQKTCAESPTGSWHAAGRACRRESPG